MCTRSFNPALEHDSPFQADQTSRKAIVLLQRPRKFHTRLLGAYTMVVRDARSAIHAGPWFASLSRLTVDHATVNKPQVVRFDADGAAPSMSREWAPAPGVEGTRARAPKGTSTSISSPGSTAPELA